MAAAHPILSPFLPPSHLSHSSSIKQSHLHARVVERDLEVLCAHLPDTVAPDGEQHRGVDGQANDAPLRARMHVRIACACMHVRVRVRVSACTCMCVCERVCVCVLTRWH